MKVIKILNNNAIISISPENIEKVIIAKGIGFGKKVGDLIEVDENTQVFTLDKDSVNEKYEKILGEISLEYFEISEKIYQIAQDEFDMNLNKSLVITLGDHIQYAIERFHKNEIIPQSGLLYDIRLLYKQEFKIGIKGLDLINKTFDVNLPEDEAAYIAVHIINASMDDSNIGEVYKITSFIEDILNILKYQLSIELDTNSVYYYRFITHLKYFAVRIFNTEESNNPEVLELFQVVEKSFPDVVVIVNKISKFIEHKYNYKINEEEKLYLSLHITRLLSHAK